MKFKSIVMRFYVFVFPSIVITTIAFIALSYYSNSSRINETINEKMYTSLYATNLEILLEMSKSEAIATDLVRYVTDSFDFNKHKTYCNDVLVSYNIHSLGIWYEPYAFDKSSYSFSRFSYIGDNGDMVYIQDYHKSVDYFQKDWYTGGKEPNGGLVWSNVYNNPVSTMTMVTATKPFFDADSNLAGVVTVDMDIENIRRIVNNISVGKTGKAFILGSNGEYISFFDESKNINQNIQEDSDKELARLGNELLNNMSGSTSFVMNGNKLRVYYMTMPNVDWILGITLEESEVNASALSSFLIIVIIPIIGLLFVTVGIYFVTKYIRVIVSKVNHFADLASYGDFSKNIDVAETDEFGIMEQRLNIMISNMNDIKNHSNDLLGIAKNASKSKSDFLSRMSHEIRTPMNAIIGMTQIAKTSNDRVRIKSCLDKIDNASKHLLALINDILDMSKIEANKLELSENEFNLEQSLTNIYSMMLVNAEEKGQLLVLNINKNVPLCIIGDELRFAQVVTNLVSNAIKFTPENGNILISVSELQCDDGYTLLKISVKDNGIGISSEQLSNLFMPFEQGSGNISQKYGGTGLGLAICRRIVEMMGGELSVSSEVGKGSDFSFTLRVCIGKKKLTGNKNKIEDINEKVKSLKVLIADGYYESNEYSKQVLYSLMLKCDSVYNGYEAVRAVEKSIAENAPYNIIFLDYNMSNLNDAEAIKRINELSNDLPVIIMVSPLDIKDKDPKMDNIGIAGYLTKPFSPLAVMDLINNLILESKIIIPEAKSSTLPINNNNILLAEDIEINREIIVSLLEDTPIKIDIAENGEQAVEMFKLQPDKYDLILMDIQMPKMDGFEATRRIRSLEMQSAKTIPIVAMTANALSSDIKKCMEAGMNEHLSKPIDSEIFLNMINGYLYMKKYSLK